MSTTAILKSLTELLDHSPAPTKTQRHGDHVEFLCAIGKDETAYITMSREAFEELQKGDW